jgi:PHS family inorganic phosphate transporter-like MFS transporter
MIVAGIVAIAIVAAFRSSLHNDSEPDLDKIDTMWRLLIGLGCVPACIALYFRLTIPETPRFTMDIERDIRRATADVDAFLSQKPFDVDPDAIVQRAVITKASRSDFLQYFMKRDNFRMLFACAWSWFALDVSNPFTIS